MKYITFPASGKLTGVAAMLECFGYDTDDRAIALGMNAPWLFMKAGERYLAGSSLYKPRWLNLYLAPLGLHMTETALSKESVPAFLRACKTAMLPLAIARNRTHPVVFNGYADGRYEFTNIRPEVSSEPEAFSLTTAMLKRRLSDQVTVFSMEKCQPTEVNFIPLLLESLNNLASYQEHVLEALGQTVTREEFHILSERLFRALIQDTLPLAELANDAELTHELRLLYHDYRHIFTQNSPTTVMLNEKLSRNSICRCIAWLREDIVDQLYHHGINIQDIASHTGHSPGEAYHHKGK